MTIGAPTSASSSTRSPEPEARPLVRRLAALVEAAAHDSRVAARRLASTPGLTVVALGILAAGIGANTAIYSVVHAALPGVESVALARQMPLSFWGMGDIPVARPGGAQAGGSRPAEPISYNVVTPAFFATLGIPVLRGRAFTDRDAAGAPRVIVVNETMAREWFGRGDPIGAEVRVGAPGSETPMQVALAAVVTRPLARFLPGVNPTDPVTYVGVVSILVAACGLAAWLPARRAARLDPIASLRQS